MRALILLVIGLQLAACGAGGAADAPDADPPPGDAAAESASRARCAAAGRLFLERAHLLTTPRILDELRRVAALQPVGGDLGAYLAAGQPSPEAAQAGQRRVAYFEAARGASAAALAGRPEVIEALRRPRPGRPWAYEQGLSAAWAADGIVPLRLDHLLLVALAASHQRRPPGQRFDPDDLEDLDWRLCELLPPRGGLAALLDEAARLLPAACREVRRGMRWVKVEVILARRGFALYDDLAYPKTPDLVALHGLAPIKLLTQWWFFPYNTQQKRYEQLESVHEDLIRRRVRDNFTGTEPLFLVVDIEHWPTDAASLPATLDKLARVAEIIHDENPGLLLGFYGHLPRRDPNSAYAGPGSTQHAAWVAHNAAVGAALAHRVDLIFPSLYTLHLGEQKWITYARANLAQARVLSRLQPAEAAPLGPAHKRRVLPYLWPQYHPNGGNNPKGWSFIEGPFWRLQLDECHVGADGIVIWGAGSSWPWDPTWPWWTETLAFLTGVAGGA